MATDVAHQAIVGAPKEALEERCQASSCEVQVTMRCRRPSGPQDPDILRVTPMEDHILIKYGDMRFKAPRADRTVLQDVLSSLYGMLLDKCAAADRADKRDPNFFAWQCRNPGPLDDTGKPTDPYSSEASFVVVQQGRVQVQLERMPLKELEGVFMRHMEAMRFLCC